MFKTSATVYVALLKYSRKQMEFETQFFIFLLFIWKLEKNKKNIYYGNFFKFLKSFSKDQLFHLVLIVGVSKFF